MYRSFTSAAALLALLPTTFAAGTAHVVSNCGFDVYFASVSQGVGAAMKKLPAGGYSEAYDKPNDGISIKISTSIDGPVTQFEFTWDSPNINYDISHINGNPFEAYGTSLVPSEVGASGYPTCVALSCPAGTSVCSDAYNQPDDVQTRVCPDSSDLTFTLCPGGSANAAPSGQAPAKSSAAAPSAAVPSSFSHSGPLASSVSSQPEFSVPAASPTSQPAFSFSRSAAVPSAPQASTPAAVPTSFQTYTTPAANRPAASSFQAAAPAPAASNAVQSPPEAAAPATTPAAQAAAPAATHSWSWGNWGHQHTRRAHSHHFRL